MVPTGSQLWSKRPELHAPEVYPAYCKRAKGITVTDAETDKDYQDFYLMNVGANVLGYRCEEVDNAVIQAIARGQSSSLNFPEEIELTRLLLTLHPWAQMARYTRSGGEAIAVAARIARAATGRSRILHCGYHGWTDVAQASGVITTTGIPKELHGTTVPFKFNCSESELEAIVQNVPPAAIIVEPVRYQEPRKGWLDYIQSLANRAGAIFIIDEISSGFRFNLGGAHLTMNIKPDIAVFSKAMGNGYPIAAVIGTRDIMRAAERTFISSTTWSERIGFAAAIATIQKMWSEDVFEYTYSIGQKVAQYLDMRGLKVTGRPQMLHIDFNTTKDATLYTQLMLEKGYLAGNQFYPSTAHGIEDTQRFLKAAGETLKQMPNEQLRGPVKQEGFPRLT